MLELPAVDMEHARRSEQRFMVGAAGASAALGLALVLTNRFFPLIDDEATMILAAATPLRETLTQYVQGVCAHEHPPLFDVLLHGWMRVVGFDYGHIRWLAALFTSVGVFACGMAAKVAGGTRAGWLGVGLGVLWPMGHHVGRVAGWFSLAFCMVALLTWSYLSVLRQRSAGNWFALCLSAYGLMATNYFGMFMVGLLGLALVIANRSQRLVPWRVLVLSAGAVAVFYLPFVSAFATRMGAGIGSSHSFIGDVANAAYTWTAMLGGEAVAPWVVPGGVLVCCAVLVETLLLAGARSPLRWLLFLAAGCILVMALAGVLVSKRAFFLGPWLLVPWAVALGARHGPRTLRAHTVCSAVILGVPFLGALDREHYAATRWVEPWQELAREVFPLQPGQALLTNSWPLQAEVLFSILSRDSELKPVTDPLGVLAQHRVFAPATVDGLPGENTTIWTMLGQSEPGDVAAMGDLNARLGAACKQVAERPLTRDPGAALKARLFPGAHQVEWRVLVREFRCAPVQP